MSIHYSEQELEQFRDAFYKKFLKPRRSVWVDVLITLCAVLFFAVLGMLA